MNVSLIMTVIGPDRPGLVESISRVVVAHDGNWVDSRMAHLAGQFAGVVRVDVPRDEAPKLTAALEAMREAGLDIVIHADTAHEDALQHELVRLELVGQDRPGIVAEITRVLAASRVNVEELNTDCTSAATTGQRLFHATARLQLPGGCDLDQLQRQLERIAGDLMVDVSLDRSPEPQARL